MTTQERNEQIALMLGWTRYNHASYFTWTTPDKPKNHMYESTLQFDSDWNWLMEAVEFVKKNIRTSSETSDSKEGEYFIDEWEFKINKYYIRLIQWTKNGRKMYNDKNKYLSILYIIGYNCSSEQEAVFLAISDFAKLYNNKEL